MPTGLWHKGDWEVNKFGINSFKSKYSGVEQRYNDLTWDEFIDFIQDSHVVVENKELRPLFNATRFKTLDQCIEENKDDIRFDRNSNSYVVARRQKNAVEVELLIIDYDGDVSIEEAMNRYKDYEYVGYTSYRHQDEEGLDRFRLIFPLVQPIPSHKVIDKNGNELDKGVFYDLSDAIMEFAPLSDPAILNGIQIFYLPSAPKRRIHLAKTWRNKGKVLDWTKWIVNEVDYSNNQSSTTNIKPNRKLNFKLDPDQLFHFKNGSITARDVLGRVKKVTCPFHQDKKGSEFLNRFPDSGVVIFHCKKCGTFSLPPESIDSHQKDEVNHDTSPLVEIEEPWWDHKDKDRMMKLLSSIKKSILSDNGKKKISSVQIAGTPLKHQFKSHIITLPEGSGKSRLALSFLEDKPHPYFGDSSKLYRNQIIFASKSWEQVIEQHNTFLPFLSSIGRTAKIAWSFDGSIFRRFKVKIKRKESKPFSPGKKLDHQTIEEIINTHPHLDERFIKLTWNILGWNDNQFKSMAIPDVVSVDGDVDYDPDLDFFDELGNDPPAIIFTTIAQLRLLEVKHDRVPLNWIIWIDDPDLDEMIDIKRVESIKNQEESSNRKLINGTLYDLRDNNQSIGVPFENHRCIYTTTEKVTCRLLEHLLKSRKVPYQIHGERFKVTGGHITILGTSGVQKKKDGIIPLLVNRISVDSKKDILLIADGLPAEFNHSTNKGRNDLTDRHIIIEISHPHPFQIKTVCDSLGLDFDQYRDEISKELMMDRLHQAVGRNSGFRSKGFECVVLVDKNQHQYLVENCGYKIDKVNSVVIDRTEKMSRKDKRITESSSKLVKDVESFLNNVNNYLDDLRKVKTDIKSVLFTISDDVKRERYIIRLLVSLTTFSTIRFDTDKLPNNSYSKKVRKLGEWLLDSYIQNDRQDHVIDKYVKEVSSDTPKKPS